MWLSGGADVASVKQQPVVRIRDVFCRYVLHQFLFYFIRRVGTLADESESVGHAIHMGVNG
jgi:hypothetical protein